VSPALRDRSCCALHATHCVALRLLGAVGRARAAWLPSVRLRLVRSASVAVTSVRRCCCRC
jgi:hypothetical protein